ncbi:hypothetical protein B0A48_07314 [Cryoendolithus antarcticus]|uniref:Uncharacterized protein n=1 Tax=Cryoendolithus antarcticus TaxID=1507870 RepID=A0A1V8T882_9PEZI|nr:hypothetical protein B0A48_07314 [Cryoendolithus antarcticus]
MDNTTLPALASPMQDAMTSSVLDMATDAALGAVIWATTIILVLLMSAVLVLYCSLAWHTARYTFARAFPDIASNDTRSAHYPDENLMAGVVVLLFLLNLTVVAINVSKAPSSTWSQHCWTLSRQMLWVHLSELVIVSTLALCVGFFMLLAWSTCKGHQGWDNWRQRRNAYKKARDIEDQLEGLEDGVEGK